MLIKKYFNFLAIVLASATILLLGLSCSVKRDKTVVTNHQELDNLPTNVAAEVDDESAVVEVVFPLADYVTNRTFKVFGQYVSDRFTGYHNAEDVEVTDKSSQHAVTAVADGQIIYKKSTSGYGGLVIIRHQLSTGTVQGIYGHLALSSVGKSVGDQVTKGEVVGYLGADKSRDTDGERQHLHFGLYKGTDINVSGYVSRPEQLQNWLNPTDFFQDQGLISQSVGQLKYSPGSVTGANDFKLSFNYPAGWRIEYVPQINALNLFTLSGAGSARERSQVFMRWFDAENFLTLDTVDILDRQGGETAGRPSVTYVIIKKLNADDFSYQPSWRNAQHQVTDIKASTGYTRFYVIAQNPTLSEEAWGQFLNSIELADN
ncbi:TPA: hypothetical protein DEB72_02450 [Patescibacteria group bacterium]|nr:hypothetical protein [Patescibacteria group bacterium]